jgi:hypothetical protein
MGRGVVKWGLAYFASAWNCGAFYQRGMDGRDGRDGMKQRVFFLSAICNLVAHLRSLLLNPFLPSLCLFLPALVPYILDSH